MSRVGPKSGNCSEALGLKFCDHNRHEACGVWPLRAGMEMRKVRLVLVTTQAFKAYVQKEAKREGISAAELVERRVRRATLANEKALRESSSALRSAVRQTQESAGKSLAQAEAILRRLRRKRLAALKAGVRPTDHTKAQRAAEGIRAMRQGITLRGLSLKELVNKGRP